ncbi:MAG: hypothetical protein ACJA0K_003129 [Maricaulis maris]|jgi:hypothetical protein
MRPTNEQGGFALDDREQIETDIDNATWDLKQKVRQAAYAGAWIAASNLIIGVLAFYGVDLLGLGTTDPAARAFELGFVVVYALIVAGFALWTYTGSRVGAVVVFIFAAIEILAIVLSWLSGGTFSLPILPLVIAYFAGRGMLASFRYQSERKRLIDDSVFS